MRKLLIVKVGDTIPRVAVQKGDFEDWFIAGLGLDASCLLVVEPRDGSELPPLADLAGALVTGSHAMVTGCQPWSERVARWLPGVVERGIPTLGICYGHQLLAHAFGGEVGNNPRGREYGTVEVTLNDKGQSDRLLGRLGAKIEVQVGHVQSVLKLPPGAERLAANAWDENQAYVIHGCAWGLQFHPEIKADVIREYIRENREKLIAERQEPDDLLVQCHETPVGDEILGRFARLALENGYRD